MDEHYERLRAEIGKEHSELIGPLSRRDMHRFAIASNAPSLDGDESASASAPPLFLSSVMGWGDGPPESELGADGAGLSETRGIPLEGVRLMGAGQTLQFHQPVVESTVVFSHASLADVQLKEGRSGKLLLMRILRRFTDEEGTALVTCEESFIAR
ncbi:MaoC family dehydratase [Amycolatopsis sp. K13G38]|uniref:MaoC family dehydratase n=1 Tax=Amycolatopsis acididurans TaxID=2724524 RepID=A0ABX1J5B0_9PSEU|nr:MaoC family dehydratase N-terminal domain-containing protein [Amycolatopsis acididurans]NKQ55005.1 MaoC family dehydratase [Amycolatopsis acididurans]